MSYHLTSLKEGYRGDDIGVYNIARRVRGTWGYIGFIKGDTRSLDYLNPKSR